MKILVIDVSRSDTDIGKIVAYPIVENKVITSNSYYLNMGDQPNAGLIVGFYHPTSKKRLKKWILSHSTLVLNYMKALDTTGLKENMIVECNTFINAVKEAKGDAEVSLVHRRLI